MPKTQLIRTEYVPHSGNMEFFLAHLRDVKLEVGSYSRLIGSSTNSWMEPVEVSGVRAPRKPWQVDPAVGLSSA